MRNGLGFGADMVMVGGFFSLVFCSTLIDMSSVPLIKVNTEYLPYAVYPELIFLSQVISINFVCGSIQYSSTYTCSNFTVKVCVKLCFIFAPL